MIQDHQCRYKFMCIVCPVSYSHYTVAVTPPYHVLQIIEERSYFLSLVLIFCCCCLFVFCCCFFTIFITIQYKITVIRIMDVFS